MDVTGNFQLHCDLQSAYLDARSRSLSSNYNDQPVEATLLIFR